MDERATAAETPLRKAQRWLASVILQPDKLDDAGFAREIGHVLVTPRIAGDACTEDAGNEHAGSAQLRQGQDDANTRAIVARLGAYTGGYPARIGEALLECYPALAHVVGHARFHELCDRYLPHVPAGIYNLNDVGSSLPAFLTTDALAAELPFAPDLARLEWAVHAAFHAREKSAFDAAPLAAWTMEQWAAAVLEFQPSVAVVRSEWPIRDIWGARETPLEQIDIELEGRPDRVLVHRSGFQVVCETLSDDEASALESLRAGRTLGETAELLADESRDVVSVAQWFARWSSRGLITGCSRRA